MSVAVDVLVPTCDRPAALAVTLAALAAQTGPSLRIVVSDQSEGAPSFDQPQVRAVLRYLHARGIAVATHHHLPRRGMAEQRAFLLAQAAAPACLYLDDDVILAPDLLSRLHAALLEQRCGFVGSAVHGAELPGPGASGAGSDRILGWARRARNRPARHGSLGAPPSAGLDDARRPRCTCNARIFVHGTLSGA